MTLKKLIILLLTTSSSLAFGQSWQWAVGSNGNAYEAANSIAKDENSGHIYIGGVLTTNATYSGITPRGGDDGFLAKYDLDGNVIWAFNIGGDEDDEVTGVTVDPVSGNVFITGYIQGTFGIEGTRFTGAVAGVSGNVLTNQGVQDAFIACYSAAGSLLWFRTGGGSDDDRGMDIAINSNGVYITGFYDNSAVFSGSNNALPSNGKINNFLAAYNLTTGALLWLNEMGSEEDDFNWETQNHQGRDFGVTADNGKIYTFNYNRGNNYRIYDGSNTLALTVNNLTGAVENTIVTAVNLSGIHQWSTSYRQGNLQSTERGIDIANDCDGVYVITSLHNGSITPGGTVIISDHDNPILAKLNKTTGAEEWARQFVSDTDHLDYFLGIETDGSGKIFATGRMASDEIQFQIPGVFTLVGDDDEEIMMMEYQNNGTFISAERIQGNNDSWGTDIVCFGNRSIYITGKGSGSIQFGAFSPPTGDDNIFLARKNLTPVIVYPNASGGTSSFCKNAGSNPTPTINSSAGGTFTSSAGLNFVSASTGQINLATSTPGVYTITYTGPLVGCLNRVVYTYQVTILPPDNATISYPFAAYCQGDTDPSPTVASPGGVYSEYTGSISVNAASGIIDVSASTTGTYYVKYTTTGACPNADSVQVTINAEDDPTFSYSDIAYCQAGTDPTPTPATSGGIFSEYSGGLTINSGDGTIDLSISATGSYWIVHTTTGVCPNVDSVEVTINAEDDPTFNYSAAAYCQGSSTAVWVNTNTPGGTFTESTGGLSLDPNSGIIDVDLSVSGSYWVVYTTSGICPNADSVQVTISSAVDPNWSSPANMCSNESAIDLNTLITGTAGGNFTGTGVSSNSFDPSASGAGTFSITYTVTNGACQETLSQPIEVLQAPVITINNDFSVCGLSATINATTNLPSSSYWSNFSGASFSPDSTSATAMVNVPSYGTHQFNWSVNQGGLCASQDSILVTFYESTIAYAGPDQTIDFKFNAELLADTPGVGSGQWSSSDADIVFNDLTNPATTVSSLKVGSNEINWTVENGVCPKASDHLIIYVNELWIPSGISPNGDGENDFFALRSIDDVNCSLEIFNRWGQKIYNNKNYENDWNGTNMKGQELENDTYFYVITINDELNYNGYIVVKR